MNTAAAVEVASPETFTAECPKCLGKGAIAAFSHVANGVCFMCRGTRTVSAQLWTEGVVVDERRRAVDWSFGNGGALGLIFVDSPYPGTCDMPRAQLIDLVKGSLDYVRSGEYPVGVCLALRLAAMNDPRAEARACAYLGGENGEKLRRALPGAHAALAYAREAARDL